MQEIKKRRIVLASVLKPVNDPRMLEKIGSSLEQKYEIHIAGQPGNVIHYPSITFHELKPFTRLSIARLFAPLKILKKVIAVKPALLIICTHELLSVALMAKILIRCRVVYDVQENYWQNIYYGKAFPYYLRPIVAAFVRAKEWMLSPLVDYYLLAERSYQHELGFTKAKAVVVENKLKKTTTWWLDKKSQTDGNIHLLFSGTLAETTGVFNAIKIAASLHSIEPRVRLLIIGYCPHHNTFDEIKSEIADKAFITLQGGDQFVSHGDILAAVYTADFGIIAYPPNPSTANAIPTKLYEYLGCRLPILLINHARWTDICKPYPAAITVDPEHFDVNGVLKDIRSKSFFTSLPDDVYWESEEKKLLSTIQHLLP